MEFSNLDFPFCQSIELAKQIPTTGCYHWKADADALGLTIRIWLGDTEGVPFQTCITRIIKSQRVQERKPHPGDVA